MQLLQYGVLSDSKPLACLLLSLGNLHPSTSQLALDMLARLGIIIIYIYLEMITNGTRIDINLR